MSKCENLILWMGWIGMAGGVGDGWGVRMLIRGWWIGRMTGNTLGLYGWMGMDVIGNISNIVNTFLTGGVTGLLTLIVLFSLIDNK